jgi:hypothetical protein
MLTNPFFAITITTEVFPHWLVCNHLIFLVAPYFCILFSCCFGVCLSCFCTLFSCGFAFVFVLPCFCCFGVFETVAPFVAQKGVELLILLPPLLERWGYRHGHHTQVVAYFLVSKLTKPSFSQATFSKQIPQIPELQNPKHTSHMPTATPSSHLSAHLLPPGQL